MTVPEPRVLTEDELVRGYGQLGASGQQQRDRDDMARRALEAIKEKARLEERVQVAEEIAAERHDAGDGIDFDAYINGLSRAETIAREGR